MSELQNYNHKEIEAKWQKYWYEHNVFKWDEKAKKEENYVIDTPPPTVSGLLHMGHIFSYTQADFIARFQRMTGKNVFYPIGFDDNGLPTERLVEKVKGVRGSSMPREEFIKICEEVVASAEEDFRDLFKSIALSVDWTQEYQTISPECRKISQLSFLDLLEKGQAYRKMQPTLWDPVDQTALAQADIEDKELESMMNHIYFSLENGKKIVIATTRPEMLPACVAVFCHPDDERYKHLIGKNAITPLFGVKVPIIADDMVAIDKGTGLVMCCTFGDTTDTEWWKKHNLPLRVMFDKRGRVINLEGFFADKPTVNIQDADKYSKEITDLKIKDAKTKILELLKENNLVEKQENIVRAVKCAERSGSPLEIMITPQWFIKILDHKEGFLKKAEEINWYPSYMKVRLENWIEGLNWDWCISRQRFFGVPFPVWYSKRPGEEGKILVAAKEDLPVDPLKDLPRGYSRDEVEPDYDVMDTWATSSVSPQLNSLGINDTYYVDLDRHKTLFPADLRPQAHEIIRTWAFYTIAKAYLHENTIPWKNIMISGWCLASDKTKMSKSKGNTVTPVGLIEEKGSDVVRYWASTSRLGADTAYSEDVMKIGRKLITKLWNASKFVSLHINKLSGKQDNSLAKFNSNIIFEKVDLWALSKLKKTIEKTTAEFTKYEYCIARTHIEDYFWNIFCDNYLEIVKARSYDEAGSNPKGQASAVNTLYHILETILRLFSPFVPHITEELYSKIYPSEFKEFGGSIQMKNTWPDLNQIAYDNEAEKVGDLVVEVLNLVRKVKADKNLSLKAEIKIITINSKDKNLIELAIDDLKNVCNALSIVFDKSTELPYVSEDKSVSINVEFS